MQANEIQNDFNLKVESFVIDSYPEEEDHKDPISYESSTKHLGKGRPYTGDVDASDGREDHVKEKRAIFRAFK